MSGLIVIGSGLPRSGTLSTKTALDIILPGKCHHIVTAFDHQEEWKKILVGEATDEEFKNFFLSNNYSAGVDGPFCFLYKRIMKLFPDAKVLLTVRDPERWSKSVQETVIKDSDVGFPATIFNFFHMFQDYLGLFPVLLGSMLKEEGYATMLHEVRIGNGVAFHEKWVSEVERYVPADRLLKFNVAQGWGPLCKFLGVPVPDEPFPRINSSQAFIDRLGKRRRRAWLLVYEFVTIPLLAGMLYLHTR